jgi:hypothetical protein
MSDLIFIDDSSLTALSDAFVFADFSASQAFCRRPLPSVRGVYEFRTIILDAVLVKTYVLIFYEVLQKCFARRTPAPMLSAFDPDNTRSNRAGIVGCV